MTVGTAELSQRYWFARGARGLFSLPAMILMSAFVGFTALALQSGISRGEAVFMTLSVWALPSQLIIVSALSTGGSLITTAIAVSLASIRFMPMVAALLPELRTEKTRGITLYIISHFVAVTAWVYTIREVRNIPREGRVAFFAGLGLTLTSVNSALVFFLYGLVSSLPPIAAGVLYFLTPIYFMTSLWGSSNNRVIHIALLAGLAATPIFHAIAPEFDILFTGLVAGAGAYAADRHMRRRKASA